MAIPKGRPTTEVVELLGRVGLDATSALAGSSRSLVTLDTGSGFRFILAKPFDVPTYVETGTADLGVVGKDVLLESESAVGELLDLGIGRCRMVVALPSSRGIRSVHEMPPYARVATRYPRLARRYFRSVGLPVQVVALHGSIELAPQVGLADAIMDLVQTGHTLKANDLVAVDTVAEISARLIVNPVRWRVQYAAVQALLAALRAAVTAPGGARATAVKARDGRTALVEGAAHP